MNRCFSRFTEAHLRTLKQVALIVLTLLAVMWSMLFLNLVSNGSVNEYGIRPREPIGLLGITLAPFMHASIGHMATSSAAFALLSALVIIRHGAREYAIASLEIVMLGGLLLWCVGIAHVSHFGSSGWMWGLLGYLLIVGVRQVGCQGSCPPRRIDCSLSTLQDLGVALVALLVSSSFLFGKGHHDRGAASWDTHLCFGLVGLGAGELRARHILRLEAEQDQPRSPVRAAAPKQAKRAERVRQPGGGEASMPESRRAKRESSEPLHSEPTHEQGDRLERGAGAVAEAGRPHAREVRARAGPSTADEWDDLVSQAKGGGSWRSDGQPAFRAAVPHDQLWAESSLERLRLEADPRTVQAARGSVELELEARDAPPRTARRQARDAAEAEESTDDEGM
jgi:membrane associated rhomboid family serine protease